MPESLKTESIIYKVAAISNFVVTIPAFVAYDRSVAMFAPTPPNYPFLVWIWAGMAFLWGVMFWEISRNLLRSSAMIKYSYLEKSITSTSVLIAYLSRNVPTTFLLGIALTDLIWIPIFIWIHVMVVRASTVAGPDGLTALS
jgi:hypothetical protein